MKNFTLPVFCSPAVVCSVAVLPLSLSVFAQVVAPGAFTSTEGNTFATQSGHSYPFEASTLQLVVDSSQLTGLTVGSQITGISFRQNGGGSISPTADSTFTQFDISMGAAATSAEFMSSTFANNFSGSPTSVRSGALTIPANSVSGGATPNSFGPEISFSTPFTYAGGNLTIQIRSSGGSNFIQEPDADSNPSSGYTHTYTAVYNIDPNATSGAYVNFPIVQLTVVPEPSTWALVTGLSLGAFAFIRRSKKS